MKNKKVYCVNGWPNNYFGTLLFKLPFNIGFVVRHENGRISICKYVDDLDAAIKHKEDLLSFWDAREIPDYLKSVFYANMDEIRRGKIYLAL